MEEKYNQDEHDKYIIYLDANNLWLGNESTFAYRRIQMDD